MASPQRYPESLPEPEYPLHDDTRVVKESGHMRLWGRNQSCYIGSAFAGERVGLREEEGGRWLVSFLHVNLGYYDLQERRFKQL